MLSPRQLLACAQQRAGSRSNPAGMPCPRGSALHLPNTCSCFRTHLWRKFRKICENLGKSVRKLLIFFLLLEVNLKGFKKNWFGKRTLLDKKCLCSHLVNVQGSHILRFWGVCLCSYPVKVQDSCIFRTQHFPKAAMEWLSLSLFFLFCCKIGNFPGCVQREWTWFLGDVTSSTWSWILAPQVCEWWHQQTAEAQGWSALYLFYINIYKL